MFYKLSYSNEQVSSAAPSPQNHCFADAVTIIVDINHLSAGVVFEKDRRRFILRKIKVLKYGH